MKHLCYVPLYTYHINFIDYIHAYIAIYVCISCFLIVLHACLSFNLFSCMSADGEPALCALCSDRHAAVRWNATSTNVDRMKVFFRCEDSEGEEVGSNVGFSHGV